VYLFFRVSGGFSDPTFTGDVGTQASRINAILVSCYQPDADGVGKI
jgi:hypothetical protein